MNCIFAEHLKGVPILFKSLDFVILN